MKWEAINTWGSTLVKPRRSKLFFYMLILATAFAVDRARAQDYETEELSPPPVMNEEKEAAPHSGKKSSNVQVSGKEKKLKISFDDELVKGQQANPEVEYIFTRSQFNYKKMIRLRENFIPEIDKGRDEFRGKR